MEYTQKEIYYVHSYNRVSGDANNFLYKIDMPTEYDFDYVTVLNASIPKSYYLIDINNDSFTLEENSTQILITLPRGNYTVNAFKNTLITYLNSNSPNGWTYAITYPSATTTNTGKFTYTVSGNGGIQPKFIFQEQLYEQMGFNIGTYSFVGDTLTSTNVVRLQLINSIYIHSDMVGNKDNSILQEIYSNTVDYANITYQATEAMAYAKKIVTASNNVYRFTLTDEYGTLIELNGVDWHFTLMCFKKNRTLEMINSYIKMNLLQNSE